MPAEARDLVAVEQVNEIYHDVLSYRMGMELAVGSVASAIAIPSTRRYTFEQVHLGHTKINSFSTSARLASLTSMSKAFWMLSEQTNRQEICLAFRTFEVGLSMSLRMDNGHLDTTKQEQVVKRLG